MHIQRLVVDHFRNIDHSELNLEPKLNWIIGDNGSGKTSLFEAICFLANGRSFRTQQPNQVIQNNQTKSVLFCELRQAESSLTRIGVGISKDIKEIHLNGERIKTASELAIQLPVQLITPKVSQLVEDGPQLRRRFLDWGLFHVEHPFKMAWSQFNRILKQRNALLKLRRGNNELAIWDSELVLAAEVIQRYRQAYLTKLQDTLNPYLTVLDGVMPIELTLYSGWPQDRELADCLTEHVVLDRKRGQTTYGPHRADIRIKLGNQLFKDIGSRGQLKMFSCALLFAQLTLLEHQTQIKNAVLLIDDLGAEFDAANQQRIMHWALESKSQILVTTTDKHLPVRLTRGHPCSMFHVEHGTFEEVIQ